MSVTNEQVLNEIKSLRDKDLHEIKEKLDTMNGRVRETEKVQAGLIQSRRHQEIGAAEMRSEIRTQRAKLNIAGMVLALGQVIAAILFGNKQ